MNRYLVTLTAPDHSIQMTVGIRTHLSGMARIYALFEWFQRFDDIPTTTVSVDEENHHAR